MKIDILTKEDLDELRAQLRQEMKAMYAEQAPHSHKQWLRSNEACRLLTVSPGTLRSLRRKGALPYIKIEGVVFYKYQDIQKMMSKQQIQTLGK